MPPNAVPNATKGDERDYVLWSTFVLPPGQPQPQVACAEDPLGLMVFAATAEEGAIDARECQLPVVGEGAGAPEAPPPPPPEEGHDHNDPSQHPFPELPLCSENDAVVSYTFRPKQAHRSHAYITEVSMFVSNTAHVDALHIELNDCLGHPVPVRSVRLDEGFLVRSGMLPLANDTYVSFQDRSGQNRSAPANLDISSSGDRAYELWATFELVTALNSSFVCASPPQFGDAQFTPVAANETKQCFEMPTYSPSQPNGPALGDGSDGKCMGICGLFNTADSADCGCDSQCSLTGDCCDDACEFCGFGCADAASGPPSPPPPGQAPGPSALPSPTASPEPGHDHSDPSQHSFPTLPQCSQNDSPISYSFRPKQAHRSHAISEVSMFVSNGVPVEVLHIELNDCLGHVLPVRSVRLDEGLLVRSGMLPLANGTYVSFRDRSGQNRKAPGIEGAVGAGAGRQYELWATFELVTPLSNPFVCASSPQFGDAVFENLAGAGSQQCFEVPTIKPGNNSPVDGAGKKLCEGICGVGSGEADCFCDGRLQ